jgi:hypothetical protein
LGDPALRQVKANGSPQNPNFSENILCQMDTSQDKKSSTCLSKGSPIINGECILGGTCFAAEHPLEAPQTRTLIDLNLPIPQDAEADEPLIIERKEREYKRSKELDDPNVVKPSTCVANSEQQSNVNY